MRKIFLAYRETFSFFFLMTQFSILQKKKKKRFIVTALDSIPPRFEAAAPYNRLK